MNNKKLSGILIVFAIVDVIMISFGQTTMFWLGGLIGNIILN